MLLNELLVRLMVKLQLSSSESPADGDEAISGPRAPERVRRAERMAGAADAAALRAAFLHEVDALFAPLASSAGLSPGVLRARS